MATVDIPYVIPLSAQKPKLLSLVPSDTGSRYKTRQLQIQVVGKSKMMKTMFVNILDVAKDMQVPPSYIGTFMGYEIGAQAKFDPKKPERQQAFLSGEHSAQDLSKLALKFIQEVVLCPVCGLPEIVCEVQDEKVHGRCRACGGFEILKIANEKFKRYILNHPPTTKGGSFSGNKQVDKKEAAVTKKEAKKTIKDKKDNESKESSSSDDEDNVVWYSDTSVEATRARREKMLPDTLLKPKKPVELAELKSLISSPNAVQKLQDLKASCNATDAEFVVCLFDTLIPKESTSLAPLKQNKETLKKFLGSQAAQISLLQCTEKFCGEVQPNLVSKVAMIVKEFYDEELVEEEAIFSWFEDKTSATQKIRDNVAPLIKWLKEAEEESESEDEAD